MKTFFRKPLPYLAVTISGILFMQVIHAQPTEPRKPQRSTTHDCNDNTTCIDFHEDDRDRDKILNTMMREAASNNYLCFVNRLNPGNPAQIATSTGKRERLRSHTQRCYTQSAGTVSLEKSSAGQKRWRNVIDYSTKTFSQFVVDIGPAQSSESGWDYQFVKEVNNSTVARKTWMTEIYSGAETTKLREICIPGTHDSGSAVNDMGALYQTQSPYISEQFENIAISKQLENGARYLDLRLKTFSGVWYTHHSGKKGVALDVVLKDIFNFYHQYKKEIAIIKLDIAGGSEQEKKLYQIFLDKFGDMVMPYEKNGANVTFADFWNKNKNIILISKQQKGKSSELNKIWGFENINDQWPNSGITPSLQKHLKGFATGEEDTKESNKYNPENNQFWVPQNVLTPGASAVFPIWTGVEKLTGRLDRGAMLYYVNRLAQAEFNGKGGINIALVDFYANKDKDDKEIDNTFDACMNLNKGIK